MPRSKKHLFISQLRQETLLQSKLNKNQLLPEKLSWLGRIVASYPWQTLLIMSAVSAWLTVFLEK